MTTIHIPKTIEALTEGLGGIQRLLVAKEWERAALVYAWTENAGRGGDTRTSKRSNDRLSMAAFARLNIVGLRTEVQVSAYRKAWEQSGGDLTIKPGDEVTLPDKAWESVRESTDQMQERVAKSFMAKNPGVVVEAIKAIPAVTEAVTEHVASDEPMQEEVAHRVTAKRLGVPRSGLHVTPAMTPPKPDHNVVVRSHVFALAEELRQEREGIWEADGLTETLLRLLNVSLDDRHTKDNPDIFDEIRAHLATASRS